MPTNEAAPVAGDSDTAQSRRSEELLRALAQGTAGVTGREFFRSLAEHAAKALGVRYSFVAECLSGNRARALAFWAGGNFGEDFNYDLSGTPCANVLRGQACHYGECLQQLFPQDKDLVALGAQSYLGLPLFDAARRCIGHLVIMDDQPMPRDALALSVLEIFASRAGAELERQQADAALRQLTAETEAVLNVNRAVGRHLERDELFGALAHCLRGVLHHDRFGIELPLAGDRLQGHLLTPSGTGAQPTRLKVLPAQGTACNWVLQNKQWLVADTREELRERFPTTVEVMTHEGMESLAALPLVTGGRARGVLYFMAAARGAYGQVRREFVEQVAAAVAAALDNCLAHEELGKFRDRLAAENLYLQEEIRGEHNFTEIVGQSPALLAVLRAVEQVAPSDSTALIFGETGTGKELIARAIHDRSARVARPLVKVNCGAISAGLVESELFGHVKGAFTGALAHRDGRFKVADGGTIFLDEVGELPLETQVKLLRVLQEQEFEPLGSSKTVKVDVRLIAATNRDLSASVAEGKFRRDLYYRLNVFPIHVPPLRERAGDVPLLASFFLQRFAKKFGKPVKQVPEDTLRRLAGYAWPGNIRELQNVIERAILLSPGDTLRLAPDFAPAAGPTPAAPQPAGQPPASPASATPSSDSVAKAGAVNGSLEEVERRHIESVLQQTNWMIEGERGAAKILNLNPSTLRSRMKNLGIQRPARRA
jgi:formate hydrogenlyase transcriptional activator